MVMTTGLLIRDSEVPVTGTTDFNSFSQINCAPLPGPFWVSISAWTEVADPLAGLLTFGMTHRNPTGNDIISRSIFGFLDLTDPASFYTSPVEMVQRENGSSLWNLETTLSGIAGSSLIAYRFMIWPLDYSEFSPL